jgi:molybdate transport system substrate-binding protein
MSLLIAMPQAIGRFLLLLLLTFLPGSRLAAQAVKVAVAANAQFVVEELRKAFKAESGADLEPIVSSSGKLTAQIRNGAPFEVFLSADTKYPDELHKAGFAAEAPKVYAYGSLVLWSREKRGLPPTLNFLTGPDIARIAVANPRLAPYGEAAVQALTYYKLYARVEKKLVFGESIAQVNQYVLSGAAPVGFTSKSVVLDPATVGKGAWVEVDRKAYRPIAQSVVLLKTGQSAGARQFYAFLSGEAAKAIFRKYGYLTEAVTSH